MKPNRFLDPIMRDTAVKEGVTFEQVAECIDAQFNLVKKSIVEFNSRTLEGARVIYVPSFGKFTITKKTIDNLTRLKEEREKNEAIQSE